MVSAAYQQQLQEIIVSEFKLDSMVITTINQLKKTIKKSKDLRVNLAPWLVLTTLEIKPLKLGVFTYSNRTIKSTELNNQSFNHNLLRVLEENSKHYLPVCTLSSKVLIVRFETQATRTKRRKRS